MANQEHLDLLKKGVEVWNQWWHANLIDSYTGIKRDPMRPDPDLSGADLSGAYLWRVDFTNADLSGADLSGAYLEGAKLVGANLTKAHLIRTNLWGANLNGADLSGAFLEGVILNGAQLSPTRLIGANLRRAELIGANLMNADFSGADLSEADLSETTLIRTNFKGAMLTNCRIYGVSAWDVQMQGATQLNLMITQFDQPLITVDNLEVAQFIYLLLNNPKIRDVIDTIARKAVLILGRFTDERKAILDAIRDALRKHDYLPILFDFDKPSSRNFTETVRTLAHLSRFILADLTDPSSIPYELGRIVPDLAVPVQPLLLEGKKEFAMFIDLPQTYHWVLPVRYYKDKADLLAALEKRVIEPAERKAQELEKR